MSVVYELIKVGVDVNDKNIFFILLIVVCECSKKFIIKVLIKVGVYINLVS